MMASLFEKVPALKDIWMDHLRDLDWIVLLFKIKIRISRIVRVGSTLKDGNSSPQLGHHGWSGCTIT
jgi:hypothetical protein